MSVVPSFCFVPIQRCRKEKGREQEGCIILWEDCNREWGFEKGQWIPRDATDALLATRSSFQHTFLMTAYMWFMMALNPR